MTNQEFNEALYYAVREDHNSSISPGYVEKRKDGLIREAIKYVEVHGFPDTPYVVGISVKALGRAAARRGITF